MSKRRPKKSGNKIARMEREHLFRFNCYPGVSCFTQCCQDITIVLTPFDVLRLKKGLGIFSNEFLEKYTIVVPKEKRLIPLVILKMNEENKKCPFVSQNGCRVYGDRPWPCRIYPLDMNDDGTFSLITDASRCLGLKESNRQKISDWMEEQGIALYDEMNEHFSSLTIQLQTQELDIDNPKIQQMTFMALYNIDRFKDFVFKSTFLDRLEVEPKRIEEIKDNDEQLLIFAYDWIKFGLFGKKVFWVKQKAPVTNQ